MAGAILLLPNCLDCVPASAQATSYVVPAHTQARKIVKERYAGQLAEEIGAEDERRRASHRGMLLPRTAESPIKAIQRALLSQSILSGRRGAKEMPCTALTTTMRIAAD
ncbi:MAG: hypothetical protein A2402_00390 [Candidatus Staskawiczbacteria bacterium RIFOXYC1_FULL_37_43]|nr:MAG: hypothetical protein A2813_00800 [Candidatus Staskawiczbacteria bacterium RIFCSPHIGHO2_01_FULL_37_17]OGZ72321.1 MAG: hypothetical protein A2891_03570 [Candidatus Staskawiczbacteria bacterium RIFCSPLOWO2_01_FULL_37_19]OGZ76085.1 MAG: hypothetical protein A2205_03460 [Candidatus Staskawiczbacteria bacterium RIFOXYA1_FULL_37_15]OGZ77131.1 MAG: hypothetical protein A2280_03430 [Candidatus Staskawiczbacteria bacterium RIFOXYA12_FULL_37_10]OGZ80052.1 MAG: hypothetical protein A2353_02180 [Can